MLQFALIDWIAEYFNTNGLRAAIDYFRWSQKMPTGAVLKSDFPILRIRLWRRWLKPALRWVKYIGYNDTIRHLVLAGK